jgi:hypothetical protein
MKTIVAVAITALICTASGFATGVAVTPGQFNALKKRVASLEKTDRVEIGFIGACFNRWTGFTSYGGYVAQDSNGQSILTSATDITEEGDTPQFWLPTAATDCSLNAQALGVKTLNMKVDPATR